MSDSDSNPIEAFFQGHASPLSSARPGPACPADETLAAFLDAVLPLGPRSLLEEHLLGCPHCLGVVRIAASARQRPSHFRLVVQLAERGLRVLRTWDWRGALEPKTPQPALALGSLRRGGSSPAVDLVALPGPGEGLDEFELQVLPDATARLVVRRHPNPKAVREQLTLVLERDGDLRERRPFEGTELAFGPLAPGRYGIQLLAREGRGEPRVLARAEIEIQG